MFAVDTNVFLYAADKSYTEHARCRKLLEKWRRQALPWCTTWAIFYEFLRVSTHPRVFARPWGVREAWRFVEAILASPALSILEHTPRHSSWSRKHSLTCLRLLAISCMMRTPRS